MDTLHKDKTFRLVKSLTKNERRYFKLFASITEGEKNYMLIFAEMEKQEKYDEKKIKEELQSKKFIKHFAFEKKYLFQMILKALKNYHSHDDRSFVSAFGDIEILIRKGMPAEARELIEKQKEHALSLEFFTEYLMLSRFELRAVGSMQQVNLHEQFINEVFKKDYTIIEQLKYALFIVEKQNEITFLAGKYKFTNHREFVRKLDEVRNDKRFDGLIDRVYTKSKIALWNYYIMLSTQRHDYKNTQAYALQSLSYIKKQKMSIAEAGYFNYLILYYYFVDSSIQLREFRRITEYLQHFWETINLKYLLKKPEIRNQFLKLYVEMTILYLLYTGKINEGMKFIKDSQDLITEIGDVGGLEFKIFMHYAEAALEFCAGNMNACIDNINYILNIKSEKHYSTLNFSAQIVFVMAHIEAGNTQFVMNYLRTFSRYFHKYEVNAKTTNKLQAIFKAFITAKEAGKNMTEALKKWISDIDLLSEQPFERFIIQKS
ncbi:MAG: hypothetical protein H7X71_05730, partial [Chitinophagales bacterium]|nr:hypothetical protein [Chitinophagales bacterium]